MKPSAVLTPEGLDSLITTQEAAALCGVSAATIRTWANRGYVDTQGVGRRLEPKGRDRQGRNLYLLLDVAKAENATRMRRARRV
ncbi:HTH DNA-binding protein [Gordonia phage Kiko]|nr:HTH DNA-binding protein [Gordonia phage Kiko]